MRSFLANLVCGVLAVIFAIGFFLCARGMVAGEGIRYENRAQGTSYSLVSQEASLLYTQSQRQYRSNESREMFQPFWGGAPPEDVWYWSIQTNLSPVPGPDTTFLGFGFKHGEIEYTGRRFFGTVRRQQTSIRVPMWFLLGAIGAWPGVRFWRMSKVRTERLQKGFCVKCGFDLQGTYHHCPKCRTRAPIPAAFPVHSWEL